MNIVRPFVFLFLGIAAPIGLAAAALPEAPPESCGVSSARLERVETLLRRQVSDRHHAGLVTLLVRNGKVVHTSAAGYRDIEGQLPMQRDSICRVYSMTKLVTSVAALMLVEEGKLGLDQPIGRWLPALVKPNVLAGGTDDAPVLRAAAAPVTVRHLLTHTAGYTYDFIGQDLIHRLYARRNLWESPSMAEFIARVAGLPLAHEPGAQFTYGINADILGAVIEAASGVSLPEFLAHRIFGPLGMSDTGFDVAPGKLARLAKVYSHSPKGGFAEAGVFLGAYAEAGRGFASGGGGLFSTADDFARFALMLLHSGKSGSETILSRKSVELLRSNQLQGHPGGHHALSRAHGFGLGAEVRLDLGLGGPLGSKGQFGWYGAATTYCTIDPQENLVAILMAQHLPFNEHGVFDEFANAFYQALR
jgi:CubicO group peptidase (beta-lactamase class C family)